VGIDVADGRRENELDDVEVVAGEVADAADDGDVIVVGYEDGIVDALPELARLAAGLWLRGTAWGLTVGLRAGARLARAGTDPETAAELMQGVGSGLRTYARGMLGIDDLEERVSRLAPPAADGAATEEVLRAQGAELLRQSADVSAEADIHPAFGRILGELAPDEGRVLRLLASEGPQPIVDVRASNLIGVGSQLVSQNLNMVPMEAGCRHPDRGTAYLGNLQRLGLIEFSDEPLEDAIRYQVLEAQPHVLEAIKHTARAKTVQRSLRLTPFGREFCAVCFPGA
jgi:abortive infection alpha-like protein